ncbi:hypothetical protein [Kibdelosporangium philippinense]|uniref:hypothetical protein n=1 Tax=Kibdelosporangium philippinense TaxID=211113 RepID=UPI00361C602B
MSPQRERRGDGLHATLANGLGSAPSADTPADASRRLNLSIPVQGEAQTVRLGPVARTASGDVAATPTP